MPTLRIVVDPEKTGLNVPYTGRVIHLADETEIVVTGLPDGMAAGEDGKKRASMAFAFALPNGDLVIAETSWRLFASAYQAFLARFGEPDLPGMRIGFEDEGPREVQFVESEKPFVQCGTCGWRLDGENTKASVEHLMREYQRHYKKRHPRLPIPPIPDFPGLN